MTVSSDNIGSESLGYISCHGSTHVTDQQNTISKYESYFGKKYPDFVFCGSVKVPTPLKRPFEEKCRSQQWRDRAKVAKDDREAVLGGAALVFEREGHKDAAYLVTRLKEDPSIASVLRKALQDLDSEKNNRLICFLHLLSC